MSLPHPDDLRAFPVEALVWFADVAAELRSRAAAVPAPKVQRRAKKPARRRLTARQLRASIRAQACRRRAKGRGA